MKKIKWSIDIETYDGGIIFGPQLTRPVGIVFCNNRSNKEHREVIRRPSARSIELASLVASAPELLEEVKRIHDIVQKDGGRIDTLAGTIFSKTLAKLIAKAEGKSG